MIRSRELGVACSVHRVLWPPLAVSGMTDRAICAAFSVAAQNVGTLRTYSCALQCRRAESPRRLFFHKDGMGRSRI